MQEINVSQYLDPDLFIPELKSKTKEDVLAELIQPLLKHGKVKNEGIVLSTLKQRETLGSTGIGKGVAIPHCRSLTVAELNITIGISHKGIAYDAIDKKDVNLFFLIVAPPQEESNLYLPVLGSLVGILKEQKVRKELLKAKDFELIETILQGE